MHSGLFLPSRGIHRSEWCNVMYVSCAVCISEQSNLDWAVVWLTVKPDSKCGTFFRFFARASTWLWIRPPVYIRPSYHQHCILSFFFLFYIRSMFNEAIYWLSIYSGALCCVTVLFLVGTVLILELYKVHVFMDVCCTCFPHFIFLCLMRMWYLYQNIYLQDKSNQCSEKESINFMKIYFFYIHSLGMCLLGHYLGHVTCPLFLIQLMIVSNCAAVGHTSMKVWKPWNFEWINRMC